MPSVPNELSAAAPPFCSFASLQARDKLTDSDVVNNETGESEKSEVGHESWGGIGEVRTSTGTFFDNGHDDVISKIEERVAHVTMLPKGGETVFPDVASDLRVSGPGWSECASQGLAHKPQKGDALMFYSLTPDGVEDKHSLHGSCPTTKGGQQPSTHTFKGPVVAPTNACSSNSVSWCTVNCMFY
eukprot:gene3984-4237_t